MRNLRASWLWVAAGCYQPAPLPGAPCSEPEQLCPSGQVCVLNECRLDGDPGDAPPATDNCPDHPSADQHNEDGDMWGDVCDNCPHVATTSQANGDGDGVGDACDPNPALAGDAIKAFYTFHVDPPGAASTGSLGTWTRTDDTYRFVGTEGYVEFPTVYDRVTVEVGGTLESAANQLYLGLYAGNTSAQAFGCALYDCRNAQCGGEEYLGAFLQLFQGKVNTPLGEALAPRALAGAFMIRMSLDPSANRVKCETLDSRTPDPYVREITGMGISVTAGTAGMESEFNVGYSLRYFIVIGP